MRWGDREFTQDKMLIERRITESILGERKSTKRTKSIARVGGGGDLKFEIGYLIALSQEK